MKKVCGAAILFAITISNGCAPGTDKTAGDRVAEPPASPVAAQPPAPPVAQVPVALPPLTYKELGEVPDETQQKAVNFARKLQGDIKAGKLQNVRGCFDRRAIVEAVFEGVPRNKKVLELIEGMERGMQTGVAQLVQNWSEQEPKFKHLVLYKGELAARFRFVGEKSGVTFIELVLRVNRVGEFVIPNLYNHAMCIDMVEQSKRTMAPVLAEVDRSFLEALVGKSGLTKSDLDKVGDLARCAKTGDAVGAAEAYKEVPESLRESMLITGIYLVAMQQGEDNAAYKRALTEAAARFKFANFQLLLVDVYAGDKEFGKAAECLDGFMSVLEKDAALLAAKGLMLQNDGDSSGALRALREALTLEPDCAYVHSTGLDILLAAKDFKSVRDSMIFLEKNAGYSFKENMEGEAWEEFKKAPESEQWR